MIKKLSQLTASAKLILLVSVLFFMTTSAMVAISIGNQSTQAELQQPKVEIKERVETAPIPFEEESRDDPNLASGSTKVVQEGANGKKSITYAVTYRGGVEQKREILSEVAITPPITKVIAKGTYVAPPPTTTRFNCDPNYSPCIPNVSYDLDCPDIGQTVRVIGGDPHRFDRDNDGYGCE